MLLPLLLLLGCCCRAAVADDAERRVLLLLGSCRAAVGLLAACCEAVAVDPALEGMLVYRQKPFVSARAIGHLRLPIIRFESRAHRQKTNVNAALGGARGIMYIFPEHF